MQHKRRYYSGGMPFVPGQPRSLRKLTLAVASSTLMTGALAYVLLRVDAPLFAVMATMLPMWAGLSALLYVDFWSKD